MNTTIAKGAATNRTKITKVGAATKHSEIAKRRAGAKATAHGGQSSPASCPSYASWPETVHREPG